MASVYHEKQEGSLCAQHALNNLLQGRYFTAVDLADIARQLDDAERLRWAEAGTESAEYLQFMQAESSNYDDSGFFSSQVIAQALKSFDIDIAPIRSEEMAPARDNPEREEGFICWLREHWFTVRRLDDGWYNLDSMLPQPARVSEIYLGLLLDQMQQEGYTVFVVKGTLPRGRALASPGASVSVGGQQEFGGAGNRLGGADADDDLQRAIAASMEAHHSEAQSDGAGAAVAAPGGAALATDDADPELAAAIAMSLSQEAVSEVEPAPGAAAQPAAGATEPSQQQPAAGATEPAAAAPAQLSREELRAKRLARFDKPA